MQSIEEQLGKLAIYTQVKIFKKIAYVNLASSACWLSIFNPFSLLIPYLDEYPSKNEKGAIQVLGYQRFNNVPKWIKPEMPRFADLQKRAVNIWVRADYLINLVSKYGKQTLQDQATIDLYSQFGFTTIQHSRQDLIQRMKTAGFHRSLDIVGHVGGPTTIFHNSGIWLNERTFWRTRDEEHLVTVLVTLQLTNGHILEILPRFPDLV